MRAAVAVLLAATLVAAKPASAQSLQRLSVQGSGALLFPSQDDPTYENQTRLGWEAQLRYTVSRLSVGAGYQRSTVYRFTSSGTEFTAALSLGFIEPRYVVTAGNTAALYAAGRLGFGSLVCSETCQANDFYLTYRGGGGVLVRLSSRTSLDLGAQYFLVNDTIESGYAMLRVGLGIGL